MRTRHTIYVITPADGFIWVRHISSFSNSALGKEIGCQGVSSLPVEGEHIVYYDDEGLRDGIDHYFQLEGHPDPLVGKLLIASTRFDRPTLSLESIASKFTLYKPVIDPIIKSTQTVVDDLRLYINGVDGFSARIISVDIQIPRSAGYSEYNLVP
ncbi:hypothetical protein PX860_27155 (plasmid) [Agrobacterium leguminum]|uniref:hypothetical protein n=1 Tax=Agrobacterium leguminum TaxID=2792015 RepID=UPI00272AD574|nr:hypothetical protein [Agrobacterium leguminum]WLE00563.1 hypothetical protein PX860_27155 [Agrobacterium leguminum]